MAENVSLSSSALSEQRSLLSRSGSMGTTRSTRYTDVARETASWSTREPGFT